MSFHVFSVADFNVVGCRIDFDACMVRLATKHKEMVRFGRNLAYGSEDGTPELEWLAGSMCSSEVKQVAAVPPHYMHAQLTSHKGRGKDLAGACKDVGHAMSDPYAWLRSKTQAKQVVKERDRRADEKSKATSTKEAERIIWAYGGKPGLPLPPCWLLLWLGLLWIVCINQ